MLGLATAPPRASAQAPLRYVNNDTQVQEISFRFVDHQTFETGRLQEQIATTAPGLFNRLRNTVAFLPGIRARPFLFDPVTLQKDVVRLRRFYEQNGFLTPEIDYPASQLDTSGNQIHVIFTIREGPSLQVRETDVLTAEDTSAIESILPASTQRDWQTFRSQEMQLRGRYTDFKRSQLSSEIQSWFRNHGFAFAEVQSTVAIDSVAHAVDLRFFVNPGPRGVVSEIQIEGTEKISPTIIHRELPFSVGDRFSAEEVTAGQQRLFDLNLFRVALADVPQQPADSTVMIRYRVREAELRSFSGQVGYGTQVGFSTEGSWRHRNFYGNARTFIVGVTAETGLPENPPNFLPGFLTRSSSQELSRRFRASVTLRQPYLFTNRLSGSLAPFVQERLNPALAPNANRPLNLNERQFGLNTSLVYDFLPYRTLSLQHSFSRTRQYLTADNQGDFPADTTLSSEDDLFNRSIFSLNGTFGKANNFINPTKGYLLRPVFQIGGYPFESGVEFVQISTELSGYLPVSESLELAGRLFLGSLWPFEESRRSLTLPPSPSTEALRRNRIYQNRFSDYLFYAGGGSDVRGWAPRLGGGKVVRRSPALQNQFVYRPIGARSKIGVNLEARFPLPGLGDNWRTAAFLDGAYLTPRPLDLTPAASVPDIISGPDGSPVSTDPSRLVVGTGAGLRYETSFGFLRMDLAYKLTPDALDLRTARDVGTAVTSEDPVPVSEVRTRFIRRFRLHFGIGRSF